MKGNEAGSAILVTVKFTLEAKTENGKTADCCNVGIHRLVEALSQVVTKIG